MAGTTVRDVMAAIDDYSAVNDDADLKEAIEVFQRSFYRDDKGIICGNSSVLVIDKAGKLTGILTIRSMLKAIDRKSAELGLPLGGLFRRLSLLHRTLAQIPVREAMSPFVKTGVKDDESAGQAIRKLLESEAKILPVIREGKVVGIIRAIDLLQSVGHVLGEKHEVILSFLTVS
jgi:CBS domain-containing protein